MMGMGMMMMDKWYLVLVVPTILLSLWAQIKVKSTFSKYSSVNVSSNLMGCDVAREILMKSGIDYVNIEPVRGSLSDHYDPRNKVLRLSEPVYSSYSVAAAGVAAHEAGHAIQQKVKYGPLVLRSTMVPVANIGSAVGPYLAILGLMLSAYPFIYAGIALFACAVLFYLITLPVEFNASRRAIGMLRQSGILNEEELYMVKKVLTAAALTYVASALTSLASLARLILLSRNRRR